MPNVLECSPSNDQSDSEPQVVCCHHLERSAAPHFLSESRHLTPTPSRLPSPFIFRLS